MVISEYGSWYFGQIREMWSDLDLGPGIVVTPESDSGYCGQIQIWVRVMWSDLDLGPVIVVISGSWPGCCGQIRFLVRVL